MFGKALRSFLRAPLRPSASTAVNSLLPSSTPIRSLPVLHPLPPSRSMGLFHLPNAPVFCNTPSQLQAKLRERQEETISKLRVVHQAMKDDNASPAEISSAITLIGRLTHAKSIDNLNKILAEKPIKDLMQKWDVTPESKTSFRIK